MLKKGMVSVIIPTYNRANTIKRAIDSVLNQTYSNIELIIVDDCSSDNTFEIINSYTDKNIRYYKLEKNSGACVARNKGIEMALGEYIAFQDSDDEWFKEKIEKQIKTIQATNTDVTFCALNRIDDVAINGEKIPNINMEEIKNITKELLKENFISTQTILGKKYVFENIKFDAALPRLQDWDLVIRVSKLYKISYLDEVLVNLYIQKDSISMNINKKVKAYQIIYEKYYNEINEDFDTKYRFNTEMVLALFNSGARCTKQLKENLKIKFSRRIFLYYISCLTRTNKFILNKNLKKGRVL